MTNTKYIKKTCEGGTFNAQETTVSLKALINYAHFISCTVGGMTFLGPVCAVIRERFIKCKIQACYPRKLQTVAHPYKSSFLGSLISLLLVLPPSIQHIQRQTNLFPCARHSAVQLWDQSRDREAKFCPLPPSYLKLDIYLEFITISILQFYYLQLSISFLAPTLLFSRDKVKKKKNAA